MPSSQHMVMTRCPTTGADIPTGIICDRDTFDSFSDTPARVQCPVCRQEHAWKVSEAWLADHPLSTRKT